MINRGIRPVWSVSSLCALRKASDLSFRPLQQRLWSDCTIWVFAGRKGNFVGFVLRRLNCFQILLYWVVESDHLPCFMVSDLGLPKSDWMTGVNGLKVMLNLRLLSCVLVYMNQNLYLGQKLTISLNMSSFIQFSFKGFLFQKSYWEAWILLFVFVFFSVFFSCLKNLKMFCMNTGTWTIRAWTWLALSLVVKVGLKPMWLVDQYL